MLMFSTTNISATARPISFDAPSISPVTHPKFFSATIARYSANITVASSDITPISPSSRYAIMNAIIMFIDNTL